MNTIDVYFFIFNNKSDECLSFMDKVDYPKEKLNITVFSDRELRHSYTHHMTSENEAYNYIRLNSNAEYIWILYADYILNNGAILKDCIQENKDIVSGLMIKPKSVFANFWGAVSSSGWYARSEDYLDIFNMVKRGCFKVPFITGNILFKSEVFKRNSRLTEEHDDWDVDMNICHNLRKNGEELHLLNKAVYGFIEETNISEKDDALGSWTEEKYLHKDFRDFLEQFNKDRDSVKTDIFKNIGPDIWQIPFFTPEFCDYLVEVAEEKNEWSGGTYTKPDEIDARINAVEHFPTQDVHLTQLDLHRWWLEVVVKQYFKAVLSHLYKYHTKGYNISFIVKYSEKGQKQLDAHHDASVYTTNIALNTYGVDYTGGGCNFVHKNVKCIGNPKGYLVLHPGRITHFHEAMPITSGKRYILVSFND